MDTDLPPAVAEQVAALQRIVLHDHGVYLGGPEVSGVLLACYRAGIADTTTCLAGEPPGG